MFKKKNKKQILVSKFLEDLPGMKDILRDPRSYSHESLCDACNNIKFNASEEIDPIENITIQFIFRNFFYILHQTGLYNPQRKLFAHIAGVEKIEIEEYTKFDKTNENAKVSDLYFYDIHGKYLLLRLEHPNANIDFAALPKLFIEAKNKNCSGALYLSNQMLDQKTLNFIREKTNFDDAMYKYTSPIFDDVSFDFIHYQANTDSLCYKMLHPDIGKDESATAVVKAELIPLLYDNSDALVG